MSGDLVTAAPPLDLTQEDLELEINDLPGPHHDLPDLESGPFHDLPDLVELEEPEPLDLVALHVEAVAATRGAVLQAEEAREQEVAATGARLRAEQERLFQIVMAGLPGAVRHAAAQGQRTAVVLRFTGADKLDEFCYLYMLKGPYNPEHRAEMRHMGARPLMQRLRRELQAAGFGVHHSWQRATNDNTLAVTW